MSCRIAAEKTVCLIQTENTLVITPAVFKPSFCKALWILAITVFTCAFVGRCAHYMILFLHLTQHLFGSCLLVTFVTVVTELICFQSNLQPECRSHFAFLFFFFSMKHDSLLCLRIWKGMSESKLYLKSWVLCEICDSFIAIMCQWLTGLKSLTRMRSHRSHC